MGNGPGTERGANLTGRLLVATPSEGGGVFARSVVLLLHHGDDGAQGVILNRPLAADVDVVLPGWGRLAVGPPTLYQGGPVAPDSALGLTTVRDVGSAPPGVRRLVEGSLLVGGTGLVDLDIEPLDLLGVVDGVRIFAGYAGWGQGQLEAEISDGAWYVVDAEAGDVLTRHNDRLWATVLARQSGALAMVAFFPADPNWN